MACNQQHWRHMHEQQDPVRRRAGGLHGGRASLTAAPHSPPATFLVFRALEQACSEGPGTLRRRGRDPTLRTRAPTGPSASATAASAGAPRATKPPPPPLQPFHSFFSSAPLFPCGQEYLPQPPPCAHPSRNTNPPALVAPQGACNLHPGSLHAAAGVAARRCSPVPPGPRSPSPPRPDLRSPAGSDCPDGHDEPAPLCGPGGLPAGSGRGRRRRRLR